VLSGVRDEHHGGAFLVLPAGARLPDLPLRAAYPLDGRRVREVLAARMALEPALSAHVSGRPDVDPALLDDAHFLEREMKRVERLLTGLARIDGAVVLERGLAPRAFGAEIALATAAADATVPLFTGPDGRPAGSRSLASFGMRHRSAHRFCQAVPGSIAFVVSQDGDVRVFCHEAGELRLHEGATPEDWVLSP
jgi:hypothetical protein